MDELIFAGNKYISSKRASKLTGYTTDYIGQMCREDKMNCRLVGRNWYVNDIAIREQKKSFKKEQLGEEKRAIEYKKLNLEPMYYSDDFRINNLEVNKIVLKNIEEDKDGVAEANPSIANLELKEKENLIPILSMIESSIVDLRSINNKNKIIVSKKSNKQIIKRVSLLPQKSLIIFPMVRVIASIVVLIGILFVASTFILQQSMYYTQSNNLINKKFQLANIGSLFDFIKDK
jgi:hypothetical protein